jgi:carboxymethylenebutenolidase
VIAVKRFALLLGLFLLAAPSVPAQDWAKERLDKSPRHHDFVDLKAGDHSLKAFVAYPEVSKKAPAVIVIHENRGLSDWARETADEIASQGYIAIAPDLMDGKTGDDAKKSVPTLDPKVITDELNAADEYVRHLSSSSGKVAVVGFCWGGDQAFRYATNNPDLKATFVFYGMPPSKDDLARIKAPVYGFYGGNDNRVTSTIDTTKQDMEAAHKTYEPEVYADAGHSFMKTGEAPDAEAGNKQAREKAWDRLVASLKKALK